MSVKVFIVQPIFGKGWRYDSDCNILYNVAAQYDLYTIESMLKD